MYSNTLISIIIPCYDDAKYIEQSVYSALNQTYPNKEIIVVDDGSNIETKVILRKLEPNITKLITQENQGQSTARNVGIEAAQGDYILVLDSDDYFEPQFCERAKVILTKYKEAKLVTCQARLLYDNGLVDIHTPKGGMLADFLINNCALNASLFKKADWEQCGRYDQNMRQGFEDWEFFIRLLKNGGKAIVIPEPLYNYRKRKESMTTTANRNKYILLKYIYLKHKVLYRENFEKIITHLLEIAENNEKNELKRLRSIDFIIGNFLLAPFRFGKKILK